MQCGCQSWVKKSHVEVGSCRANPQRLTFRLHHLLSVKRAPTCKYLAQCLGVWVFDLSESWQHSVGKAPATLCGTCGPSVGSGKGCVWNQRWCWWTDLWNGELGRIGKVWRTFAGRNNRKFHKGWEDPFLGQKIGGEGDSCWRVRDAAGAQGKREEQAPRKTRWALVVCFTAWDLSVIKKKKKKQCFSVV